MNPTPGDAATLLVNLCICGPVIYIGVWMMTGPSKMVSVLNEMLSVLNHLEGEFRRFRDYFESPHWRDGLRDGGSVPDSPVVHTLVRLFGLALAICGLLRLVGIVD